MPETEAEVGSVTPWAAASGADDAVEHLARDEVGDRADPPVDKGVPGVGVLAVEGEDALLATEYAQVETVGDVQDERDDGVVLVGLQRDEQGPDGEEQGAHHGGQ